MIITHASYSIFEDVHDPEVAKRIMRKIELIGRSCYVSEGAITEDSHKGFVQRLIARQHEAMLEHVSLTLKFVVDRGVSHEIVRHRIASYAQESTRYCVAGDTKLIFSNHCLTGMTVAELFENAERSKNGAWKRMRVRQYNEETGELCFAGVNDVFHMGEKECVKIKTNLGYELSCTRDHKVLTPHGYVMAGNLKPGNKVYVNGTPELYKNHDWLYHQNITLNKTFVQIANEFGFNVSTLKKWARKLGLPKKGTGYFHIGRTPWNKGVQDERQVNALREYHHCGRRKDKILKRDTVRYQKHKKSYCEVCGYEPAENDAVLEVHHKDHNRTNNAPDNLITLCKACHQRLHNRNLLVAFADTIDEITSDGVKEVYDIEMNSDFHNFVANGIVVHNCNYSQGKFGSEITVIQPCFLSVGTPEWVAWYDGCKKSEDAYFAMLAAGRTAQEARDVLPTSLKTTLWMTMNIRELRHFLKLRAVGTTGAPHPQMVEIALPLLRELQEALPELFGDIEVKSNA